MTWSGAISLKRRSGISTVEEVSHEAIGFYQLLQILLYVRVLEELPVELQMFLKEILRAFPGFGLGLNHLDKLYHS